MTQKDVNGACYTYPGKISRDVTKISERMCVLKLQELEGSTTTTTNFICTVVISLQPITEGGKYRFFKHFYFAMIQIAGNCAQITFYLSASFFQ